MEPAEEEAPKDRMKLVAMICLLHGMGVLISWNMFINAWDYFTEYKLIYSNSTHNITSNYVGYFMQYLTFTSQFPNLIFTFVNAFVRMGGSLTLRILGSLLIVIGVFVFTLIMAMVNTQQQVAFFFWITMFSVALMQVFNAIYQNSLLGLVAILPGSYMGLIIIGNNTCGTFTSLTKIFAKLIGGSYKWTAVYYFSTAIVVMVGCFFTFFMVKANKFYRYNMEVQQKQKDDPDKQDSKKEPYWDIIKQTSPQLYNILMNFIVTLACFPAILASVHSDNEKFVIKKDFYGDVMCFLNFNVFAMIGSIVAGFYIFPKPRFIWIPVTIRLLFIPFFLFCNYTPLMDDEVRRVDALIKNDWVYLIVGAVHAFTCGYYASAAMMLAPGMVEHRYAHIAGMIAGVTLILGIFLGIMIAFIWPPIMFMKLPEDESIL